MEEFKTEKADLEVKRDQVQAKVIYFTRHAHANTNQMKDNWLNLKASIWDKQLPEKDDILGSLKWLKPTWNNWMDAKVSAKGLRQLEVMKKHTKGFLKLHKIEVIHHSDLRRACRTCEELFGEEANELSIPRIRREDLREEFLIEKMSSGKLQARVKLFLTDLSQRKESRLLLVGHSKFFRTMLGNINRRVPNATTWRVGLTSDGEIIGEPEIIIGPEKTIESADLIGEKIIIDPEKTIESTDILVQNKQSANLDI